MGLSLWDKARSSSLHRSLKLKRQAAAEASAKRSPVIASEPASDSASGTSFMELSQVVSPAHKALSTPPYATSLISPSPMAASLPPSPAADFQSVPITISTGLNFRKVSPSTIPHLPPIPFPTSPPVSTPLTAVEISTLISEHPAVAVSSSQTLSPLTSSHPASFPAACPLIRTTTDDTKDWTQQSPVLTAVPESDTNANPHRGAVRLSESLILLGLIFLSMGMLLIGRLAAILVTAAASAAVLFLQSKSTPSPKIVFSVPHSEEPARRVNGPSSPDCDIVGVELPGVRFDSSEDNFLPNFIPTPLTIPSPEDSGSGNSECDPSSPPPLTLDSPSSASQLPRHPLGVASRMRQERRKRMFASPHLGALFNPGGHARSDAGSADSPATSSALQSTSGPLSTIPSVGEAGSEGDDVSSGGVTSACRAAGSSPHPSGNLSATSSSLAPTDHTTGKGSPPQQGNKVSVEGGKDRRMFRRCASARLGPHSVLKPLCKSRCSSAAPSPRLPPASPRYLPITLAHSQTHPIVGTTHTNTTPPSTRVEMAEVGGRGVSVRRVSGEVYVFPRHLRTGPAAESSYLPELSQHEEGGEGEYLTLGILFMVVLACLSLGRLQAILATSLVGLLLAKTKSAERRGHVAIPGSGEGGKMRVVGGSPMSRRSVWGEVRESLDMVNGGGGWGDGAWSPVADIMRRSQGGDLRTQTVLAGLLSRNQRASV